jgi:hypothetical protein
MIEKLRTRIAASMKPGTKDETSILHVLMGEMQKKSITKEGPDFHKIVRSLVENNNDAIAAVNSKWMTVTIGCEESTQCLDTKDKLEAENKILQEFLPVYMSKDEIKVALQSMLTTLKEAKSSGQATAFAVKYLKDRSVEGGTVKEAVEELRQ